MIRSWLIKILICFPYNHYTRKKQQEKNQVISSCPSICHTFSSPLKVSMLRKVRCRIQSKTLSNNLSTFPLAMLSTEKQSNVSFLNESQNCSRKLNDEHPSLTKPCKQYPSLIAIDIHNYELSEEQISDKSMKQPINFYSRTFNLKSKTGVHLHR